MGYSRNALSGFTGQTVIKILSNGLVLVKVGILARILGPSEFGLFSLITIALGLTEAFTQTGVNTTIVQSKHPVSYFVNTAWVIAIVRGFIIGAVMLVLGWGMSQYYDQGELWWLIALAGLVPVIKGFINPAIIGLYKELRFISDSAYRFSLVLIETLAIIGLVWLFRSVEAWILGLVVAAVFEVAISFIFLQLRPRFEYLRSRAALIFAQTKVLSLNAFLSYLIENVDNLIIGKLSGEYGLGLYQPTYGLAHEPNFEIAKSVHHGTLPVYTKIVDDKARLRKAFTKTALATLAATVVLSLPLLVLPELIISIILGEQWLSAVPLIRMLTLAGLLQGLAMVVYTLLIAKHKVHLMNWHMGLNFIVLVGLLVFFGTRFGLEGAVLGVLLSRVVALPVLLVALLRNR